MLERHASEVSDVDHPGSMALSAGRVTPLSVASRGVRLDAAEVDPPPPSDFGAEKAGGVKNASRPRASSFARATFHFQITPARFF
jgi:hypothetical protein